MLEVIVGHVLSFVELLGGLQYLSPVLPFKRRHSAEFSGAPMYSYIIEFVKCHFHTAVDDHVRSVV